MSLVTKRHHSWSSVSLSSSAGLRDPRKTEMAARFCCRDALPFAALATMEAMNVGLNTLFKAATNEGMSHHVFLAYAYAVAALVLSPAPFFSRRSKGLPPFSVLYKIGLLGIIGGSGQIVGYTGINYSSPVLASAISNLTPAFTFIMALIFRMEKVDLRKESSQAKIIGTVVSIAGAFVVTLYKGPPIFISSSSSLSLHQSPNSSNSNWIIGGICLTFEYLGVPLWYVLQTQIMREYPNELTVIFFYNSCVSIIATVVGLFTEGNSSAWKIRPSIALASILCTGFFGSCVNNTVHTWALKVKGPVFVAMFKPLSIAIAVAMGFIFLSDSLYLGSLVGAMIIFAGFYTVMWGKAKEEMVEDRGAGIVELPSTDKVPLLHSSKAKEEPYETKLEYVKVN